MWPQAVTSDTVKDIVVAHFLAGRRKNYLLRRMSEAVTRTSEAASRQERGERPNHSQGEGVYVCVQGGTGEGRPIKNRLTPLLKSSFLSEKG